MTTSAINRFPEELLLYVFEHLVPEAPRPREFTFDLVASRPADIASFQQLVAAWNNADRPIAETCRAWRRIYFGIVKDVQKPKLTVLANDHPGDERVSPVVVRSHHGIVREEVLHRRRLIHRIMRRIQHDKRRKELQERMRRELDDLERREQNAEWEQQRQKDQRRLQLLNNLSRFQQSTQAFHNIEVRIDVLTVARKHLKAELRQLGKVTPNLTLIIGKSWGGRHLEAMVRLKLRSPEAVHQQLCDHMRASWELQRFCAVRDEVIKQFWPHWWMRNPLDCKTIEESSKWTGVPDVAERLDRAQFRGSDSWRSQIPWL